MIVLYIYNLDPLRSIFGCMFFVSIFLFQSINIFNFQQPKKNGRHNFQQHQKAKLGGPELLPKPKLSHRRPWSPGRVTVGSQVLSRVKKKTPGSVWWKNWIFDVRIWRLLIRFRRYVKDHKRFRNMKCEPLIVNILRKGFLEIFCHCMTKEDEMFGFHGRSAKKCRNARFRNFQHIHLSSLLHPFQSTTILEWIWNWTTLQVFHMIWKNGNRVIYRDCIPEWWKWIFNGWSYKRFEDLADTITLSCAISSITHFSSFLKVFPFVSRVYIPNHTGKDSCKTQPKTEMSTGRWPFIHQEVRLRRPVWQSPFRCAEKRLRKNSNLRLQLGQFAQIMSHGSFAFPILSPFHFLFFFVCVPLHPRPKAFRVSSAKGRIYLSQPTLVYGLRD